MCVFPRAPKVPAMPERQSVQVSQDPMGTRTSLNARRRRGFWASIMTSPQGVSGPPSVTGTSGTLGKSNY